MDKSPQPQQVVESFPGFPAVGPQAAQALEQTILQASLALQAQLPPGFAPCTLITLGSGLGSVADRIEQPIYVNYADIPGMAISTAPGHAGRFIAGRIDGKDVICMQGRLHPYEGFTPLQVTLPIRIAAHIGAQTLITTNASGAINTSFSPGQVVAIRDHINLTGTNPLIGANLDTEGPRFPDMTHAYSPALKALAQDVASHIGVDLKEGVYLGLSGPSFETPAEIRAFRTWGADLVGMSTVWEVIVARHIGMEVLGLSMVTNMAAGILDNPISSEDIDAAAQLGAQTAADIILGVISQL